MTAITATRICPFCESSCGLKVTADPASGEILDIRGDPDHPASRGFLCAKSQGLRGLREDPDRLTRPLLRRGEDFVEIGWDEALDRAAAGLNRIRERDGIAGLGIYLGNPGAHNAGVMLGMPALLGALPALMVSAASIDSFPRFLASLLMYGNQARIPMPDVERTDFFLMFGANPLVSNGSMMGAPDMPRRLKALGARGGQLVVVDPRRTETAAMADRHLAPRPGSDALLLLAMIQVLFAEGLARPGRLAAFLRGREQLERLAADYPPERVAAPTGIDADAIRQLARDFASAPSAVAYGRVGACCQRFGSLAIWLIDCLNVLTGNLDRAGGALFPAPAVPGYLMDLRCDEHGAPYGRLRSRVSATPAIGVSFPTQVLWEEIETPGEGQIRGLLTVAGNPALSNANAGRVMAALDKLEFMVSVDYYLNETSRHADIILPPMDHLKRPEMTLIYNEWMVENSLSHSPALLPRGEDEYADWDILTALAARLAGLRRDEFLRRHAQGFVDHIAPLLPRRPAGMGVNEMLAASGHHQEVEQLYDLLLRCGPEGDGYGTVPGGISLDLLKANPSGISLGPVRGERLPGALATPDRCIDLAPPALVADLPALEEAVAGGRFHPDQFLLINRRHPRSNNSWMHNLHALVKGPERCLAWIHPLDAAELGVEDGDRVRIRSRVGEIDIAVQLNDAMARRVVSVPHGWSHGDARVRQRLAQGRSGANVNLLSDDADCDRPSGNAAFNGVPVSVQALIR
ncbi:MAG: molybdopterin-dependent oxidoreductase [Pseudomonadota bacterium]|nr:molybdopterin-dependent oxidoreductase [Pseudomonadota bacterium]